MRISRRLDSYILTEVVGPFLGGILFFIFIFLMFQVLRLADSLIIHGVSLWIFGKMMLLLTLSFLPMVLPVAFLIAVLMAFGRLSADSELVAMKASGVSLFRLSVPISFVAMIVVALSLALNMEWVPWCERAFKTTLIKVGNTKVVSAIKEGTFTTGFFDLLIFADKVDSKTNRLKKVFIYDEREHNNPMTIIAESGEVVTVRSKSELASSAVLKLYNGSIHRNDGAEGNYQKINFGEYRLFLKVDEGADSTVTKPQMIPYSDLTKKIAATTTETYEGREFRGEYWRRVAIAISPLLFVFLGIGFGTVRTRAVRAGAALVAFVTLLVYWTVQTVGTIAVQRGALPPFIAMQLANIAVIIAGTISFRKAMW
jgi:lipopolysaccharide export system permease protein